MSRVLRHLLGLAAVIVVAQFDAGDAAPRRCWFITGVEMGNVPPGDGPFYLSRAIAWSGPLEWVPVRNGDRDAAARRAGFKSAKECSS